CARGIYDGYYGGFAYW
nr:immunoglobulin heavy chain junction region [Mus musculus]